MPGCSSPCRPVPETVARRSRIRRASGGVCRASGRRALLLLSALVLSAGLAAAEGPPDFRLKDLDGNWLTLSEAASGQVVYVTFWATWCVPCRREIPHLQALSEELGDRGLRVISVNTDPPATQSKIKPYVKRYGITYTTVLDPDNTVLDKYNPTRELPYGVLLDRQGNVRQVFPGYRTGDEVLLREKVLELLGTDGAPSDTAEGGAGDAE